MEIASQRRLPAAALRAPACLYLAIEPAVNVAKVANRSGVHQQVASSAARRRTEIAREHGRGPLLGNNVLAHLFPTSTTSS